MLNTCVAARARCISYSSKPGSAKNDSTVWAAGSFPFFTSSFTMPAGNLTPMSRYADVFLPCDGRVATHFSSNGVIPSTVKAPTKK